MKYPRSPSGFGGRGENAAVRGQISDDLPVHSGSMDQESAGIWTAQSDSQAGQPKPDRPLGRLPSGLTCGRSARLIAIVLNHAGVSHDHVRSSCPPAVRRSVRGLSFTVALAKTQHAANKPAQGTGSLI